MQTIRSFIAIELPDGTKMALSRLQNRFKPLILPNAVRWISSSNIHLTLHFLGDVPKSAIDKIVETLRQSAVTWSPFSLRLAGVGCFPNFYRPRIVWVRVEGETDPLIKLRQDVGERLKAIDFIPETRPYSPHLTIGRVKEGLSPTQLSDLGQQIELLEVQQLAPLAVTAIYLIQSDLRSTGGPIYTPLAEVRLGVQ